MSSLRFATPDALLGWLKKLAAEYRVLAPRQEGPSVLFRPYAAADLDGVSDPAALLRRATASPKEAMLPHSETLVRFSAAKDEENPAKLNASLDAPREAEPTVVFGLRPCDARGFVVLDRPYMHGKFQDPYYTARREATIIITQACPTTLSTCFCHWVGSHPADAEGSDVLFTVLPEDQGGGYVLEAVSDKGRALLDGAGFADADDKQPAVEAAHMAAAGTLCPSSTLEDIPAKLAARFTDSEFWIKETAKCLSCGACTYLCPTCQCFTITDEGSPLEGRRLRSWDSCMSPQFTLETSGHNPRAEKFKRMRNRISHKFSYYPQSYGGAYSCVGCGRCVASCPVSLDIRRVVAEAVGGAVSPADTVGAAPAEAPADAGKKAKSAKKSSGKE